MPANKLNKAQLAEVKDLYVKDSYPSVKELSKIFNVSNSCIKWTVNYKNFRERQTERVKKWKKENPAWNKVIQRRAFRKYWESGKGKKTQKKYYNKTREKRLAYARERYRIKRSLINKIRD